MSDPLSVIASVVALLDTGTKTAKHLRHLIHYFRHADNELITLSNEVTGLRIVLTEVECASQDTTTLSHTQLIDALSTQLNRAKAKLLKLDTLIHSLYKAHPSGASKVNKLAWLSKKALAKRL